LSAAGGFEGEPPAGEPSEEELRAAYEAELGRITTTDLIAQATISILNLGARKLAPPAEDAPEGAGGQDLEQVRDAIDAVRAMLEILERRIPQELPALRDALSRLQMAYAQEVQRAPAEQGPSPPGPSGSGAGGAPDEGSGEGSGGDGDDGGATGGRPGRQQPQGQEQHRPGPAESSGRLWVPGK
jgi:hypothetical protein